MADDRRANIYFNITSPTPGTFIIALHFKGRDKPILEMDLKIDDLLEKVRTVRRIREALVTLRWCRHSAAPLTRSKKIQGPHWTWSMSS